MKNNSFTHVLVDRECYELELEFLRMWESRGYLTIVRSIPCMPMLKWIFLKEDRDCFWNEFDDLFSTKLDEGPFCEM